MLKRKFGDRSDWKRVVQREYAQMQLDTDGFSGHVTLLKIVKASEPLFVNYHGKVLCIVNDGYMWLQHFPANHRHAVTTMFNSGGEIIQWYIDICCRNGISEEGVPWLDDLFLDIVVLPSGEVIQKDAGELEEALLNGSIDEFLYQAAWEEAGRLQLLIKEDRFELLKLSEAHMDRLLHSLR